LALGTIEQRDFGGGEHKTRATDDVRGRRVFVVHSTHGDAQASANDRLCRMLFFIGALKDAGAAEVTACIPYLAYSRKDRRTQPQDPVTTRYVAALFEAVGTDRVAVLDVHNEAAFDNAFRCRTVRLDAASVFTAALAGVKWPARVTVASPDMGGIKRAEQFRAVLKSRCNLDTDLCFMHKTRRQGVLSGETFVGDVAGSDVLLFDDLIASGATMMRAVRAARQAGARSVWAIATHAVFAADAIQLFGQDGPDTVMVSDSVPIRSQYASMLEGRLRVCSVASLYADLITQGVTVIQANELARAS